MKYSVIYMVVDNKESVLMRKTAFITITLLLASFSAIVIADDENSNNQVSVKYPFENPVVEKVEIGDDVYDQIIMLGAPAIGDPGEPCLPAKGAYILLPQKTQVSEIHATPGKKVSLGAGFTVVPAGQPIPLSQQKLATLPVPNEAIYNSDDVFPSELYTKVGIHIFRGNKILVLMLHPVQYVPSTGELFYYTDMTITVELEQEKESINPLFRGLEKDRLEVIKKVDNPTIIDTYHYHETSLGLTDAYDLLIITTDELKDGFEPLKNAHNSEGIDTTIKTLTDIGGDDPEDIRNYIRDAYTNWGIDYVLLGGDDDVVPARILWVFGLDENTTPYETYMPSDLYYACLNGPYNYDGDDKWGEPTDGEGGGDVDLVAEVYVGRACVGNSAEVDHFVDKTIAYMNSNDEYQKDVLLAGEYLGDCGVASWGGNYLDQLINGSTDDGYTTVGIPSNLYDIETLYDRDGTWSKTDITNRINNGVHIINHLGHSNYDYNMKMYSGDVDALTNDRFCFVYSQGCMAGGFDNGDCIAEHFTVKTENAAFAVIMNARYGWFWSYSTDGDSQRFHRQFWDAIFGENISEISRANQDSKEDNLYIIERSCIRWCYYQLNLFGDPTLAFKEPIDNDPPETPDQPNGPTEGEIEIEYNFTTNAVSDPDGDPVYYLFDWDDGADSGWVDTPNASHAWTHGRGYDVRVKAKDNHSAESDWSPAHTIVIEEPYEPVPNLNIKSIEGGKGITVTIENNGDGNATGIDINITIEGGLIILPREFPDIITTIAPDESMEITMSVFGIGLGIFTPMPEIIVTAECAEGSSDEDSEEARIFFSKVTVQE